MERRDDRVDRGLGDLEPTAARLHDGGLPHQLVAIGLPVLAPRRRGLHHRVDRDQRVDGLAGFLKLLGEPESRSCADHGIVDPPDDFRDSNPPANAALLVPTASAKVNGLAGASTVTRLSLPIETSPGEPVANDSR